MAMKRVAFYGIVIGQNHAPLALYDYRNKDFHQHRLIEKDNLGCMGDAWAEHVRLVVHHHCMRHSVTALQHHHWSSCCDSLG
jgi:hypothetical protein